MEQFVCVRVVQAWGMDLSLFQFHGQLTWSVFFLNADRTIYGRYGSRAPSGTSGFKGNDRFVTLPGFRKAVEGALEIHKGYPGNKAALAGKTGPAPVARTPEAMPAAAGLSNVRQADGKSHGCVHCHQVQDWELLSLRAKGPVEDRVLWPWPMPDAVGLSLDPAERATVTEVAPGSAAAKAGLKPGDRIAALGGQSILSIADVQWVLQQAKEPCVVKGQVERGAAKVEVSLALAEGWRRAYSFADNLSLGWITRQRLAGFRCDAVGPDEKQKLGLGEKALALRIREISPDFVKDRNTSPKKAGLQKGDLIVEVDGRKDAMTESDYLAFLVQKKKPGGKVDLAYVRGAAAPVKVTVDVP